jgi:two-component system chemotaxis sensor kinase CheA
MLVPLIKAAGYQVTSMASALEALAAIRAQAPVDVVVTDIEMPDMDGFAFAAALRSDPATVAVPVIALSAMVSADVIERGRRAGFQDFVAKFDRTGLIAAIKGQTEDLNEAA